MRADAPGLREIMDSVLAEYPHMTAELMRSTRRARHIARPRMIAMMLARDITGLPFPRIGRFFGGRDHSTVIHARDHIQALCERGDEELKISIAAIRARLTGEDRPRNPRERIRLAVEADPVLSALARQARAASETRQQGGTA